MIHDSVLSLIGNTPLVRLNRVARSVKASVIAKLEYLNPGGSVKDRVGIAMLGEAEKRGVLKPGATIVEATCGNAGVGLALASVARGYKMIFTMPDRMSQEKVDTLKAFGAQVILAPSAVEPGDPRSYRSLAARLAREIPGAFQPNQFENPANPLAHYQATGPEIWEQTEGQVDAVVAGMGTGGTISGIARFLKEKKPEVQIVVADPDGSAHAGLIKGGRAGEPHAFKIEGIGDDTLAAIADRGLIDEVVTVSDKDAFTMARRLAREEGLFCGGSAGANVCAALRFARALPRSKNVVAILPDAGTRYLSRIFNDAWMEENQLLEETIEQTAFEILMAKSELPAGFVFIGPDEPAQKAISLMRRLEISQIPVIEEDRNLGVVEETKMIDLLIQKADLEATRVRDVMGPPLPEVDLYADVSDISALLAAGMPAVLVKMGGWSYSIITKFDLLHARR